METERQKRFEARKRRITTEAKRKLDALDELHKSLDPRGWNSQRGQALLDLLYNNCTQTMADVATLQCDVLDLQEALLSANERPAQAGGHSPAQRQKAAAAMALRGAHPELTQAECAGLFGCSASGFAVLLAQAMAARERECQTGH